MLNPPTPPAPIGAATTPVKEFSPLPVLKVKDTPALHDISIWYAYFSVEPFESVAFEPPPGGSRRMSISCGDEKVRMSVAPSLGFTFST